MYSEDLLRPDWFFSGPQTRQFRFNRRLIAWPIIQRVVLDPKHQTVDAVSTEMRFIGMARIQAISWVLRQFKFWAKALGPSVPFRKESERSSIRTGRSNVTQHAVGSMWIEGDRSFWAARLWPWGWFGRRKSCRYIFISSNRNTMG
jgi:hypothetical protein